MGTFKRKNKIGFVNKFAGEEFDLAEIKRMTNWNFFDRCQVPIYQGRVMDKVENSRTWKSQLFPLNNNRSVGQINFSYSKGVDWNVTMSVDDLYEKKADSSSVNNNNNSCYFIIKYKYNVGANLSHDGDFCRQIMVFGGGKSKASVSWRYSSDYLHSILTEVFQVPTAIPNFYRSANNKNMIVGKMEKFNEARRSDNFLQVLDQHPRFIFGSADQQMTLSFGSGRHYPFGLIATLHIVNERADLVPFLVTFTLFSEKKNKSKDLVKKIVLRQQEKTFNVPLALAFYGELDNMMANDTLYYKVVLEPLEEK